MKNCPFCQSFDIKIAAEFKEVGGHEFHVVFCECKDCKSRGPSVAGEGKQPEDKEAGEAIVLWDKRT